MEAMNMTQLNIVGTEDTPTITFHGDKNELRIEGRSLPEDVSSFYAPVFEWLDWFNENVTNPSNFIFKLEYFNTASSKILLDILMKLEDINNDGKVKVNVEWHYMDGDDDMQEAGEEYKELVEIPFSLIGY